MMTCVKYRKVARHVPLRFGPISNPWGQGIWGNPCIWSHAFGVHNLDISICFFPGNPSLTEVCLLSVFSMERIRNWNPEWLAESLLPSWGVKEVVQDLSSGVLSHMGWGKHRRPWNWCWTMAQSSRGHEAGRLQEASVVHPCRWAWFSQRCCVESGCDHECFADWTWGELAGLRARLEEENFARAAATQHSDWNQSGFQQSAPHCPKLERSSVAAVSRVQDSHMSMFRWSWNFWFHPDGRVYAGGWILTQRFYAWSFHQNGQGFF